MQASAPCFAAACAQEASKPSALRVGDSPSASSACGGRRRGLGSSFSQQQSREAAASGPRSLECAATAFALAAFAAGSSRPIAPLPRRRPPARQRLKTRRRLFESFGLGSVSSISPEDTRQRLLSQVNSIRQIEASLKEKSDDELRALTQELQQRATQGGEQLDTLLPEAFAVVVEASWRVLGLRHYDEQLMGGILLHEGKIAEMATGEGKTLVAILPAFLNALQGKGAHVVTVNDYLARRDAEWVGQPLRLLGLSVGVVQAEMSVNERRKAYYSDVTYVTNTELGFDYLKDQMVFLPEERRMRQRDVFHFAVVDEADSVLIDEARVPLVVSTQAEKASEKYSVAKIVADNLAIDTDYTLEEKRKMCFLTDGGNSKACSLLGKLDLYNAEDPWAPFVATALSAKEFYRKDCQYLVKDGGVVIIDEFTGRAMEGRQWSRGLHQAVEAKEGVTIQPEAVTLASISYQNLFRLYGKRLSGMTGTAATAAAEFDKAYELQVAEVPTHRPKQRQDLPDRVYVDDDAKFAAVISEVKSAFLAGTPVLVGTASLENTEKLSALLGKENIPHQVLNARPENIAREADIVAASGRRSAVTIATNMAGRGTDILLGGDPAEMARLTIRERLYPLLFPGTDASAWKVAAGLASAAVSEEASALLEEVCAAAAKEWRVLGGPSISQEEASENLARVCKGAAALDDEVLLGLRRAFEQLISEFKPATDAERAEVLQLGGLYVIGTERNSARRIDDQLRGRAGRQGDPGKTRFVLSLQDSVFQVFGGDELQEAIASLGDEKDKDAPIESFLLSSALDEAQTRVENFYAGARMQVFRYDEVMDQQRKLLYELRGNTLLQDDAGLFTMMREWIDANMDEMVAEFIDVELAPSSWPLERIAKRMNAWYEGCVQVSPEQLLAVAGQGGKEGAVALQEWLKATGQSAVAPKVERVEAFGENLHFSVWRQVILMQIDKFWVRHLTNMEHLADSVKLRAYGESQPLVEYKLEGYKLFQKVMAKIRQNSVFFFFKFQSQNLTKVADGDIASAGGRLKNSDREREAATEALHAEAEKRKQQGATLEVRVEDLMRGSLKPWFADESKGRPALLRWLGTSQAAGGLGLELVEDGFARAVYVRLHSL
eukprot:TRINITY_DN36052_c0_g1_i1.p1 TRINITY_DN36052_c0_g1~~TRINITY_DN36052_c0_g1_i1.p1  ORF type:complete len:1153 (+),score=288.40 TRINITY_DN36052_c0_g1_i1:99-3461(+)